MTVFRFDSTGSLPRKKQALEKRTLTECIGSPRASIVSLIIIMKTTIINLTPHSLLLHGEGGSITIPASGQVARLAVTRENLAPLSIGGVVLPVARPTMGQVTGLPDKEEGVVFVVSALVADAAKRPDVMAPGELVRDAAGVIIGARGLNAFA